jgi:hypothetical protein
MNRAEQLKAAIGIIKPVDRIACEKLLQMALDNIAKDAADMQYKKDVASKHALKALTSYHAALRRARVTHENLPDGMKRYLEACGRFTDAPTPKFDDLIAICDQRLKQPRPPRSSPTAVLAAEWAALILQRAGMNPSATRHGKWVELAAILFCDKSIDMLHHCRQWKQQAALD